MDAGRDRPNGPTARSPCPPNRDALRAAGLLIEYLVWLGILIPPLGGVVIGDFLARWRGGMPRASVLPAFEWRNLGAYVIAAVAACWSNEADGFTPPAVGVVVAVVASTPSSGDGVRRRSQSSPDGGTTATGEPST